MRPGVRTLRHLTTLAVALSLAACASTRTTSERGSDLDLGLVGPDTPPALSKLAEAPYALAPEVDCAELWKQVRELDLVLGPDVDAPRKEASKVSEAVTGLLRAAVPYRGVIRWAGGAARKERTKAQAILVGTARRGFLKGVARQRGCPAPGETGVKAPG